MLLAGAAGMVTEGVGAGTEGSATATGSVVVEGADAAAVSGVAVIGTGWVGMRNEH